MGVDEYFVETTIVADKSMLDYHVHREDLEAYLYTLMNIVSSGTCVGVHCECTSSSTSDAKKKKKTTTKHYL